MDLYSTVRSGLDGINLGVPGIVIDQPGRTNALAHLDAFFKALTAAAGDKKAFR